MPGDSDLADFKEKVLNEKGNMRICMVKGRIPAAQPVKLKVNL